MGRGNSQPSRITKQSNGLLTYTATEGSNAEQKVYTDFDSRTLTFLQVFGMHAHSSSKCACLGLYTSRHWAKACDSRRAELAMRLESCRGTFLFLADSETFRDLPHAPVKDQLGLQKCGVLTNKSGRLSVDFVGIDRI